MSDEETSSVKEHRVVSGPTSNAFAIGAHNLATGEKVIVKSDDADLPENLTPERVYYVIDQGDNNNIKLASSYAASQNGTAITVYGGTNLVILSRVSDKAEILDIQFNMTLLKVSGILTLMLVVKSILL